MFSSEKVHLGHERLDCGTSQAVAITEGKDGKGASYGRNPRSSYPQFYFVMGETE
jgi:hypothetical protein